MIQTFRDQPAEWTKHPGTVRFRKEVEDALRRANKELISQAITSTDPSIRAAVTAVRQLEATLAVLQSKEEEDDGSLED